jgi:hypothetical protein
VALLPHRIEQIRRDQILHLGQQALKFLENFAASQGEFEALRRSHQKVILKHHPGALQGAANRRLAQQQPRCGRGDAFLLRNRLASI